jgi:HEAT repeat protein
MSLPNSPSPQQLASQLQSPDSRERVLAMLEVQKETLPADVALPLIKLALADDNAQIRGMAAFALGLKPTPESLGLLIQSLTADSDYNVRAMAAGALGYLGDVQGFEPLRHAFYEDHDWLVQFSAAVALGNLKVPDAETVLLEALTRPEILLQEAAIMALGEIGAVDALEHLLPFVTASDWMLRKRLAEALANLPDPRSTVALMTLAQDANTQVAAAATLGLEQLNSESR